MAFADPTPDVLLFDSGVGARAVDAALKSQAPQLRSVIVEDRAGFPYGGRSESDIHARTVQVVTDAVAEHRPASVLLACNTASLCAAATLKATLDIPVHATLPPLAEAARLSCTRHVALLATPATIAHAATAKQIALFAERGLQVLPLPCPDLARQAEDFIRDGVLPDPASLRTLMAPVRQDARIDTVVMACTHYTHLRGLLEKAAFRPFYWVDSSALAAQRFLESAPGVQQAVPRRG